MALTRDEVAHVARLARLSFTDEELDRFGHQLNDILQYADQVTALALEAADEVARTLAAGEPGGPLAGAPLALKDILCTDGIRTTAGSRILDTYKPPYDATVVRKLRAAGIPVVGKANMDEFAMGS